MNFLKNRKIKILLILQFFVLSGLVGFAIMPTHAKTNSSNLTDSQLTTSMQNAHLVAIYDKNAATNIKVDGVMSPGEYPESFYSNYTGMTVGMAYNGSSMFVYVSAPTAGWVGVGFNTLGYGMVGGDLKVGWVVDNTNQTQVKDYYATKYDYPTPDTYNDVTQANGTQQLFLNGQTGQNTTNLEFVFTMNNNTNPISLYPDSNPPLTQDKLLEANQSYSLLLAYGPNEDQRGIQHDSLGMQHVRKGIQTLFIAPEGVQPRHLANVSFHLNNYGQTATSSTVFTGYATVTDNATNNPIAGADVGVYLEGLVGNLQLDSATTNASGVATFNFTFTQHYSDKISFLAMYSGGIQYKKASSSVYLVSYEGSATVEQQPFMIIPTSFDFIVPWLTGLGAIATVACIWMAFAFVIYTVIFKNAVQPNGKKSNKGESS